MEVRVHCFSSSQHRCGPLHHSSFSVSISGGLRRKRLGRGREARQWDGDRAVIRGPGSDRGRDSRARSGWGIVAARRQAWPYRESRAWSGRRLPHVKLPRDPTVPTEEGRIEVVEKNTLRWGRRRTTMYSEIFDQVRFDSSLSVQSVRELEWTHASVFFGNMLIYEYTSAKTLQPYTTN